MAKLYIDNQLHTDTWIHLDEESGHPPGDFTVPLSRWLHEPDTLIAKANADNMRYGVRLGVDDDPLLLAEDIDRLALIVIEITSSVDGRYYSTAARIREHLSFQGELRATGRVEVDQLTFMQRCGINAYELGDDLPPPAKVGNYQRHYQSGGPRDRSTQIGSSRVPQRTRTHNTDEVSASSIENPKRYVFVDGVIHQENL